MFNKTASLHNSASDKLAQIVADTRTKLNLVNEYIYKNEIGTWGDKILNKLWARFNKSTWKENLSKNDIRLIRHKHEELFRSQERQISNVNNKNYFLYENRMFNLHCSAYYQNVLASKESAAQKLLTRAW